VNLIWMWGGGVMPDSGHMPVLSPVRIHGAEDDAWLAGCARLAGGTLAPLSAGWPGIDAARYVMVLPAASDATRLLALESDWFLPALDCLRSGRIPMLDLRVGRQLHRVRYSRIRNLLRRRRPWWQAVGT
jgi:hypothetical protein